MGFISHLLSRAGAQICVEKWTNISFPFNEAVLPDSNFKKYTYHSRIVLNLQNYCEDSTESSYRFYSQFSRILISYISMLCLSQFIISPNPDTCIHAAADPAGLLCRPITWMTMKIKLTLNTYLLSTSYGPGIELAFCINHRI